MLDYSTVIKALDIEITKLNKEGYKLRISLGDGKLENEKGPPFTYSFDFEDEIKIPEDSPIQIIYEGATIDGTLGKVALKKVYIELQDNYGDSIPEVILINNPAAFLERLKKKYQDVVSGKLTLNNQLIENLLDKAGDAITVNSYADNEILYKNLRQDQIQAVLSSLNHKFHFIWGPPGTGKTVGIAEILFQLLKSNKRVLIASNTHKAVDEVFKKLLYREEEGNNVYPSSSVIQELLAKQQILRWGGSKKFKEDSDIGKQVSITMDELVVQKSALLEAELLQHKTSLAKYTSKLSKIKNLMKIDEFVSQAASKCEQLEKENDELSAYITNLEVMITRQKSKLDQYHEKADKLKEEIESHKEEREKLRVYIVAQKEMVRLQDLNNVTQDKKIQLETQKDEVASRINSLVFSQKQLTQEISIHDSSSWIANLFAGRDKQQMLKQIGINETNINDLETRNKSLLEEITISKGIIQRNSYGIGLLKEAISKGGYTNFNLKDSTKAYEELENVINHKESIIRGMNGLVLEAEFNETTKLLKRQEKQLKDNTLSIKETSAKTQEIREDKQVMSDLDKLKTIDVKAACESLEKAIDEVNIIIEKLTSQLNLIKDQIIKDAKLIGCTLTKAMMSCDSLVSSPPDVVLVDEFSMVGIALLFFVTGISKSQVIYVGDPNQLPPIYTSENELVKTYLGTDIFTALFKTNKEAATISFLEVQRRMNPDISKIVNLISYDGLLKDGVSKEEKQLGYKLLTNGALTLIDTSNINPWSSREKNLESGSRVNFYSALLGVKLIDQIHEIRPSAKVGYITPYAGQSRLINTILKEKKLKEFCLAGTVHRYQGDEKEVIIFDLTDSNPYTPSGLLKQYMWSSKTGKYDNETQARKLINVACSRAQKKLIVIANLKYFVNKFEKSTRKNDEPVLKMLDLITSKSANIVFAETVLGYDSDGIARMKKEVNGEAKDKPLNYARGGETEFLSEMSFYTRLEEDLASAKQQVIILSPFITFRRVSLLLESMQKLNTKAAISIYTKPVDEQSDPNNFIRAISELKKIGIENIYFRKRMHEKIVIIDESIVYFGSLNPLSQFISKELMIRSSDSSYLAGLKSYVNNIRDHFQTDDFTYSESKLSIEGAINELKKLRRLICFEKRLHFGQVLQNLTVQKIVELKPTSIDELVLIPEFSKKNYPARGFEERIFSIVQRIQ